MQMRDNHKIMHFEMSKLHIVNSTYINIDEFKLPRFESYVIGPTKFNRLHNNTDFVCVCVM